MTKFQSFVGLSHTIL